MDAEASPWDGFVASSFANTPFLNWQVVLPNLKINIQARKQTINRSIPRRKRFKPG